jgi:uncharacterized coiled-coil DUF342 family protein
MGDNLDLVSDVGELRGKVDSLSSIANKLDTIIERLVDQHDRHIAKIYDDMERRRMETQDQIKEIHERIDTVLEKMESTEERITGKIEKLQNCILQHNKEERQQLDSLLKWKWQMVGGILVMAWLLSHVSFDTIARIFH